MLRGAFSHLRFGLGGEKVAKKIRRKTQSYTQQKESDFLDRENICFIISPIGKEGTTEYSKYKDALEYVIKPAIDKSGYKLNVVRADDIERAGSLIKDILQNLVNSFVVIAELTEQNPNVFYELGVRHSISPRTILIAQSLDDIPSDLRDYRTIIYDTSAKGAMQFQERLSGFLREIYEEPERPDNPVLDRLGSVVEIKINELKAENARLKGKIANILREGLPAQPITEHESVDRRMERIFKLFNAEEQDGIFANGSYTKTIGDEKKHIYLENKLGNFQLYFVKAAEKLVKDFWYVSIRSGKPTIEEELADMRVIMEDCAKKETRCTFIIVTDEDLAADTESIQNAFNKIKSFVSDKYQKLFKFELWDREGLLKKERELGIKVN